MTVPLVCVVDASVAIKLYLQEPLSNEAHGLFAFLNNPSTIFHVPDLFFAECANILWKHVQRGNATAAQATSQFASITQLPFRQTSTLALSKKALDIALAA